MRAKLRPLTQALKGREFAKGMQNDAQLEWCLRYVSFANISSDTTHRIDMRRH